MSEKIPSFPNPEVKEQEPREHFKEEIRALMETLKFKIEPQDQESFEDQVLHDDRHVRILGKQIINNEQVVRFLKICVPDNPQVDDLFRVQIGTMQFLKENGVRQRETISSNLDRRQGFLYALMDTFEGGDPRFDENFQFNPECEGGELLGEREARATVAMLEKLHEVDLDAMPPEVKTKLQKIHGTYESFFDEVTLLKDKRVLSSATLVSETPLGEILPLYDALGKRLHIYRLEEKIPALIKRWEPIIRRHENGKEMLVHGDLGPGNLYVHADGEIEPIDIEWAGITRNEILGTVVDVGNFLARAWNNPQFREDFRNAIIEKYREKGAEEAGEAIVSLSVLRSILVLSGFFENYPLPKQDEKDQARRREATEADFKKAWEIAGLVI